MSLMSNWLLKVSHVDDIHKQEAVAEEIRYHNFMPKDHATTKE